MAKIGYTRKPDGQNRVYRILAIAPKITRSILYWPVENVQLK